MCFNTMCDLTALHWCICRNTDMLSVQIVLRLGKKGKIKVIERKFTSQEKHFSVTKSKAFSSLSQKPEH